MNYLWDVVVMFYRLVFACLRSETLSKLGVVGLGKQC